MNIKQKLEKEEKQIIVIEFTLLSFLIILSTIIRHAFPNMMQVPETVGPFIIEGYPAWLTLTIFDISTIIQCSFAFYHCMSKLGWFKGTQFFIGAFIFAGLEETISILLGRFGTIPTYYFTSAGLWFFEIPFFTCLGWFILTYSGYTIVSTIFSKAKPLVIAMITGLLATILDFWIDPALVNMGLVMGEGTAGLWVWANPDAIRLFSIPIMNFLGWWLVITCFTYHFQKFWQKPDTQNTSLFKNEKEPNANKIDLKKKVIIFIIMFPLYWIGIMIFLNLFDFITIKLWTGVNIFPVDFI